MEDISPLNNISRSSTIPMVSPIPFETTSDQYYFSPISNQLQGTSPDMYWQYNDHRRSPYPNGFNNVGQYQYWRHSPYPTGDQNMLMREWSTSSPDPCSYQMPPWSMEAVSMVQGMNMHQMNHGISQWSTGSARTSLDFSGSGDTSISDLVIPPEFPRDEHMSLEQENRSCNSFNASPWQQSNCTPLITELLGDSVRPLVPKYSSCRWQTDVIPLCDSETKELENKCIKTEPKKSLEMDECCEKKMDEKNTKPKEATDDPKTNKDKSVLEKIPGKRHAKCTRKPEAYDRQKKVQRQREGLIRKAIQTLNLILPDDNKGKKLSKNLVLLKAIDHIKKLKEQLGDTPVTGIESIADETKDATAELPQKKPKKRKRPSSSKITKIKGQDIQATPEEISLKHSNATSPELPSSSSSSSPQKLTHLPLPPKTVSPSRAPQSATNNNRGANKHSPVLDLLQDPAILTPSDTSSGSERAESPTTDEDGPQQGEITSHVKRPMNAFLLFSKSNRENFKKLYPGKDNRRISTILGEHWNTMKAEEKQPFQEVARELMRKTKETYPDFKYSPKDQSSEIKVKAFRSVDKEDSPKKSIRVGNHRLRSRHSRERNSDSSVSSKGSCSGKEKDMQEKAYAALANKNIPKNELKQQPMSQLQIEKHRQEEIEKADKDYRYSRCDNWVQCDKCKKWRMLDDDVNLDDLPDKWFCWMSQDPRVNNCQIPEAEMLRLRKRSIKYSTKLRRIST